MSRSLGLNGGTTAAIIGGILVGVVLPIGGVQIYLSATTPDKVVSNTSSVGYADE